MISDENFKQFIDKETGELIKPVRVPDINVEESNKDVISCLSFSHRYENMVEAFGEPCFKTDKQYKKKPVCKWNLKFADETIAVIYTSKLLIGSEVLFWDIPFWHVKTLKVQTKHSYCSACELVKMYLHLD
jgi:hypothetical protein